MSAILSFMGITAIVLAAASLSASGPWDSETARTRCEDFELLTGHYGGMIGRPIGPVSAGAAERYVRQYDQTRRNASAIIPDFSREIGVVLTASSAQLARQIDFGQQDLRLHACFEAGIRRDSRCVPHLTRASWSADKSLRIAAAQALIPMPIGRTRAAFVKHLGGRDSALRWIAAYALARHDDNRGAKVLWKLLERPVNNLLLSFRFDVANALMDVGQAKTRAQLDRLFELLDADARRLCPRVSRRGDGVALRKLRHCLTDMSLYQRCPQMGCHGAWRYT